MRNVTRSILNFLRREDGPTAVECALMLALIVVICIVAINGVNSTPQVDDQIVVEASQN